MSKLSALIFLCVATACSAAIQLGVDVLQENNFKILEGKKFGLVAHPASVDSHLKSTIEILRRAKGCKLVALFGPEHGVYGDEYASIKIADRTDPQSGLPIYSLYGQTRKPTLEMLKGLDALVFDLQDIGSRSYTYISTMKLCLEACAEADIELIVLDRPNPLGGKRIEGPMVEKGFESFISALSVPYLHGMTMGELAQMIKEEYFPQYDKLTIIKMSGWKRDMVWEDTKLNWVPTSPHIPQASTCAAYAATGIIGELGQISNGVGYPQPFELIGSPEIKAERLAEALNFYWMTPRLFYQSKAEENLKPSLSPKGIYFRSARFKPFYSIFKDLGCQGVQVYLDLKNAETLVEINFRALSALGAAPFFRRASSDQISMFDKSCGTDQPRRWLVEDRDLNELFEKWKVRCEQFRKKREKFLLY